jgi:hypothetical protein
MFVGDVHTVPHAGGWANELEGGRCVSNTASTKAEAQPRGRKMTKSETFPPKG